MIKSHELFLLVIRLICDCARSGNMSDWHFQSRLISTPPLFICLYRFYILYDLMFYFFVFCVFPWLSPVLLVRLFLCCSVTRQCIGGQNNLTEFYTMYLKEGIVRIDNHVLIINTFTLVQFQLQFLPSFFTSSAENYIGTIFV